MYHVSPILGFLHWLLVRDQFVSYHIEEAIYTRYYRLNNKRSSEQEQLSLNYISGE